MLNNSYYLKAKLPVQWRLSNSYLKAFIYGKGVFGQINIDSFVSRLYTKCPKYHASHDLTAWSFIDVTTHLVPGQWLGQPRSSKYCSVPCDFIFWPCPLAYMQTSVLHQTQTWRQFRSHEKSKFSSWTGLCTHFFKGCIALSCSFTCYQCRHFRKPSINDVVCRYHQGFVVH